VDFTLVLDADTILTFATLFVLEIVLGVDNVIFISILAAKLPVEQQARARNLGLTLGMLMRVGLVFAAGWIITLTNPLFTVFGNEFSGRDLILIVGGLFLVYKAVREIHQKLEGVEEHGTGGGVTAAFGATIIQIMLLDLVFSLDSVITAVGMTTKMIVIISAVLLSFGILLFASRFIFAFVNAHPTVKMLALSFLLLIGVFLIADGFGVKVDKALIYGPMAFAVFVEVLNLTAAARRARRAGKERDTVRLHTRYPIEDEEVAVAAATAHGPHAGSVGLSGRPVRGENEPGDRHQEPRGLG
jgi:predicted tellurium resistance membrane protein TerC